MPRRASARAPDTLGDRPRRPALVRADADPRDGAGPRGGAPAAGGRRDGRRLCAAIFLLAEVADADVLLVRARRQADADVDRRGRAAARDRAHRRRRRHGRPRRGDGARHPRPLRARRRHRTDRRGHVDADPRRREAPRRAARMPRAGLAEGEALRFDRGARPARAALSASWGSARSGARSRASASRSAWTCSELIRSCRPTTALDVSRFQARRAGGADAPRRRRHAPLRPQRLARERLVDRAAA